VQGSDGLKRRHDGSLTEAVGLFRYLSVLIDSSVRAAAFNDIGRVIHDFNLSFREDGVFNDLTMVMALFALNEKISALAPELSSVSITGLIR
jgi:hypothetical protein